MILVFYILDLSHHFCVSTVLSTYCLESNRWTKWMTNMTNIPTTKASQCVIKRITFAIWRYLLGVGGKWRENFPAPFLHTARLGHTSVLLHHDVYLQKTTYLCWSRMTDGRRIRRYFMTGIIPLQQPLNQLVLAGVGKRPPYNQSDAASTPPRQIDPAAILHKHAARPSAADAAAG